MEDSQRKGKVWLTTGFMLLVGVAAVYVGIVGITESSPENGADCNSAASVSRTDAIPSRSEAITKKFPQFNPVEAKMSIDQIAIFLNAWENSELKACGKVKNDCTQQKEGILYGSY